MTHTIEVLDRSGHISITWDPLDPDSVAVARREFDELRAAGYQFFRVTNQDQLEPSDVDQGDGTLVVKRIEPEEAAPTVAPAPVPPVRRGRGRPPKAAKTTEPKQERTVAMRPMRGG